MNDGLREAPRPSGLLLIDKAQGPSSAEIVRRVSRIVGKKTRVGHAGTLDPDATGLLVLLVGNATRLSDYVMELPKAYEAVVRLGVETDTYDATGQVVMEKDPSGVTMADLERVLPSFTGTIRQRPPAFSAVKIEGQRAYKLARSGDIRELPERDAVVHELRLVSFENPLATLFVRCGKGMYLRTLAHDIGRALAVGAHVSSLRRTAIGPFAPALSVDDLAPETWRDRLVDGARIFEGRPVYVLTGRGAMNLRRGLPIRATDFLERPVEPLGLRTAVLDEDRSLVAVATIGHGGAMLDRRVIQPL